MSPAPGPYRTDRDDDRLPFALRPARPVDKLLGVVAGIVMAAITIALTWWAFG